MKKITDKELQTIIDDVQAEMSQHIKAFKMEGETDLLGTLKNLVKKLEAENRLQGIKPQLPHKRSRK